MDDYELSDEACPKCGHCPTHWRRCQEIGCDDGFFDEWDDDPINYAPGECMTECSECHGTGFEHWCPHCGCDLQDNTAPDWARYQVLSARTDQATLCPGTLPYKVMGLCSETGELAGKVKKLYRDKGGQISDADREALKLELGDVLWYLTQIATELDLTLEEIAGANLVKLFDRLERGVINGEGDRR